MNRRLMVRIRRGFVPLCLVVVVCCQMLQTYSHWRQAQAIQDISKQAPEIVQSQSSALQKVLQGGADEIVATIEANGRELNCKVSDGEGRIAVIQEEIAQAFQSSPLFSQRHKPKVGNLPGSNSERAHSESNVRMASTSAKD